MVQVLLSLYRLSDDTIVMSKSVQKINVLLFWPNNDWGLYGRTYEKVAEHLAELPDIRRVVCVFPPTHWKKLHLLRPITIKKVAGRLWLINENRSRFKEYPEGTNWRIRDKLIALVLRLFLRVAGFNASNTMLWIFPPHPYIDELVTSVPHMFTIAQIVDNFAKIDRKFWLYDYAIDQYPKIPRIADMVITSSTANYDEFSKDNKRCYYFENAVDRDFIASVTPMPCRINGTRPRIGYVGWLTERTDLSLVNYVAKSKPEWDVVLAGPQYKKILDNSEILSLDNIIYLGAIPYTDVPAYLGSLDVCIIPHKDTDYSRSMSPLKLYQYLASGRPVVSTDIAGLEQYAQYICVAAGKEEFVSCIENSLISDSSDLSAARIDRAGEETWDIRINSMYHEVKRCIESINAG